MAAVCAKVAPGITFEVVPWHERAHEESWNVSTHLIFSPLAVPSAFRVEPLYEDEFVCVMGRGNAWRKRSLNMKEYLSFRHISVETQPKQQNLIDRSLVEAGQRRRVAVHLPYFMAAIQMLETTDMVLTMPARIAKPALAMHDLRCVKAPREIVPIRYSMVWHPRFDSDLLHTWLRKTVREIFHSTARGA